jgi:hypothetical protein
MTFGIENCFFLYQSLNSQGSQQALFLRHEGYLGAIGAFLKGAEEYGNKINSRFRITLIYRHNGSLKYCLINEQEFHAF